jgi:hypothetical protein
MFSFVLLVTSLLAVPPPLTAQQVHYEYDALGRVALAKTTGGGGIRNRRWPAPRGAAVAARLTVRTRLGSQCRPGRGLALGTAAVFGERRGSYAIARRA